MLEKISVSDAVRMWTVDNHVEGRVKELWKGRKTLTPLELLDLEIPLRDRFWILLRGEVLSARVCTELSCRFAAHTLHIFERQVPNDARPREALEFALRCVDKEGTSEEKIVAYSKALEASHSTGTETDIDSASMAAYAVAQATGGNALGASYGAVGAAELDAPGDYPSAASEVFKAAEEGWQVEQVRELLTK